MVQEYKSQAARQEIKTANINGRYEAPRGYGRGSSLSSLSVLQGMEEQLQKVEKEVIDICVQGETPFRQKIHSLGYKLGLTNPKDRVGQKIHCLEKTLAKFDLDIARYENATSDYMRETRELTADLMQVGRDCLAFEKLADRLTEEYAKLEEDEAEIKPMLQSGRIERSQSHSLQEKLQQVHEEKKNLDYDLGNCEHQLSNAMEVYETLNTRLEVREDQYTLADSALRCLRDKRRDIFKTTEFLKLNSEDNSYATVMGIVRLMQESIAQTEVGDKIVQAYEGLQVKVATVMEKIPENRCRRERRHNEMVESLKEKNKRSRAERMQAIKQKIYGDDISAEPAGSSGSNSSAVSIQGD